MYASMFRQKSVKRRGPTKVATIFNSAFLAGKAMEQILIAIQKATVNGALNLLDGKNI